MREIRRISISFFVQFCQVEGRHPHILAESNRILNMDKTEVESLCIAMKKVLTATESHSEGFKLRSSTKMAYKHVTAVVFVSINDLKIDLFCTRQWIRIN